MDNRTSRHSRKRFAPHLPLPLLLLLEGFINLPSVHACVRRAATVRPLPKNITNRSRRHTERTQRMSELTQARRPVDSSSHDFPAIPRVFESHPESIGDAQLHTHETSRDTRPRGKKPMGCLLRVAKASASGNKHTFHVLLASNDMDRAIQPQELGGTTNGSTTTARPCTRTKPSELSLCPPRTRAKARPDY